MINDLTSYISFVHHRSAKYANSTGQRNDIGKKRWPINFYPISRCRAFIISCRVKSDIKFGSRAIDSSVSLCLPSVIIARVDHFSRGQFSPFRLRRQWSKEERWLMMLFFSLFHKSSDYRLIGNETAAARSAKSNLRGNNDRSIKESDVLQLQDAFWGDCFFGERKRESSV